MGNCLRDARWAHMSPKDRDSLVQRKKMDLVPRIRQQRRVVAKKRAQEAALETASRERLKKRMGAAYVTQEELQLEAQKCCSHCARKQEYAQIGIQLEAMEAGVDQWSVNTDMGTVMLKVLTETEQGLTAPEASVRLPDMVARLEAAMRTGGTAKPLSGPVPEPDAGTGTPSGDRRPAGLLRSHRRHTALQEDSDDDDDDNDQRPPAKNPEVAELLQQIHSEIRTSEAANTPHPSAFDVAMFPVVPTHKK